MLQGHHQFHFGVQIEVGRDNYAQSNIASGAFDFCVSGQACFTSLPGVSGTGLGFADFLLGYADNFNNLENHFFAQAVVPSFTAGQQIYRALYFDDSWRATRRLTLNLGLRYDLQGPVVGTVQSVVVFRPEGHKLPDAISSGRLAPGAWRRFSGQPGSTGTICR